MTERPKWWRAFLPKWKTASKDSGPVATPGSDPVAKQKDPSATAAGKTSAGQAFDQQDSGNSCDVFLDDTFDDSHLESIFNEQTSIRKFKISRSGRFKDRQKIRSTLPTPVKETENVATEEDTRWQ
ncbi:unnamed protein product [Ophioblennius macclurei]